MEIFQYTESFLSDNNLHVISKVFSKPWGGYFVIDENQSKKFLNLFFNKYIDLSLKMSPKVLVIRPNKRLSWQYHNRRSEIWSVIKGDILVSKSKNNSEGGLIKLKEKNQIEIGNKIRHRIIGTDDYALVAEIWIHIDKNNFSDENDIIRLQDDFNRN